MVPGCEVSGEPLEPWNPGTLLGGRRFYNTDMKWLVGLGAAALVASVAAMNVSREQAASFQKKLDQIVLNGDSPTSGPRQTLITEGEVNSYLYFSAGNQLPVGVTEPTVGIHSQGKLNGRAVVDLDLVRRKKSSGSWFDPLSYLTGRLPLTASGTLQTHEGRGQFTLESAAISGVPIPKAFLQEIVSYYTRTTDTPNGINIDDPFDLPAEIQKIEVQPGQATIIQ